LEVLNTFSPTKATNLAEICNPITCQAIELESYPNHPRIQQVLQSKSKKTFFVLGGGISGCDVTKKAWFGNFGYVWPALGPNPLTHSFGSKFS